jgi:hypothetical protein
VAAVRALSVTRQQVGFFVMTCFTRMAHLPD